MKSKRTIDQEMSDYIAMKKYIWNVEGNIPIKYLEGAWKIQTLYEAGQYSLMLAMGNDIRKLFKLKPLSKQRIFEIAMMIDQSSKCSS